jgi:hypothetical protein
MSSIITPLKEVKERPIHTPEERAAFNKWAQELQVSVLYVEPDIKFSMDYDRDHKRFGVIDSYYEFNKKRKKITISKVMEQFVSHIRDYVEEMVRAK